MPIGIPIFVMTSDIIPMIKKLENRVTYSMQDDSNLHFYQANGPWLLKVNNPTDFFCSEFVEVPLQYVLKSVQLFLFAIECSYY